MIDKRNFYINGKWVKPFKTNFRAPGFPDELIDSEKEEKGYEI